MLSVLHGADRHPGHTLRDFCREFEPAAVLGARIETIQQRQINAVNDGPNKSFCSQGGNK